MSTALNDFDIHQIVSRFKVDVQEEASVILHYIWRDNPTKSSTLSACSSALTDDKELYQALKVAHAHGRYDIVRKWQNSSYFTTPLLYIPISLSNNSSGISLSLPLSEDTTLRTEIHRFLAELQPTIRRLVVGDIVLPTWSPSTVHDQDPEIIAHLNSLRIPSLKGKPNLLLHDLGSFTCDVLLERRLRNIFMPNNHTFVKFREIYHSPSLFMVIQLDFSSILLDLEKPGFYWKASVRTGVSTLHPLLIPVFLARAMFRIVFKHVFPTLRAFTLSFLRPALPAMKLL